MEFCGKANTAKQKTKKEVAEEKIKIEILGSYDQDGKIKIGELINNLKKIGATVEGVNFPLTVTIDNHTFIVEEKSGNITIELEGPTANILDVKLINGTGEIVTEKPEEGALGYYASFKIELTELGVINEVIYGEEVIPKESERYKIPVLEDGDYIIKVNYTVEGNNYQKDKVVSVKNLFKKPIPLNAEQVAEAENFAKISDKIITNYKANGQTWKLFYADVNNMFLITSNYVPVSKLQKQKSDLGFSTIGDDGIYWSNSNNFKVTDISSEVTKRFMLNEISKIKTSNNGYKMTACLTDITKWTEFVDNEWADEAIGSPTLEMWVASWNKKYPSSKLYCGVKPNTTNGYGISDKNDRTTFSRVQYFTPPKGMDYLYFLNGRTYWLATPGGNGTDSEITVEYVPSRQQGLISDEFYNRTGNSLRPVVHLNSNIGILPDGENYKLVKK